MILTKNELLYLDDHITLRHDTESADLIVVDEEFMLTIGGALLEALKGRTAPIVLTYDEAKALREVVKHSGVIGQEKVGMSLKEKIHNVLQDVDVGPVVEEVEYGNTSKNETRN